MNEWLDDFRTAVAFLTRLPMPHPDGAMPPNFVRAHRMFPVVGALIGAAVGLLCLGLRYAGVPDLAAAALALGGSAMITGALHEDGLADVADGFGGGRNLESKLEIMRDSRLGTYGALILLVSFAAKLTSSPTAPYVPRRLSRMISSFASRLRPPPNPSATSARPSSCSAPVRTALPPSASAAAARSGTPA